MTFTARGRITFDGVIFVIEAQNSDEAWAKAVAGDYVRRDLKHAVAVDWKITPNSLESHK